MGGVLTLKRGAVQEELFANQYGGNIDEMCKWLRVDSLGYLTPEGLVEAATKSSGTRHNFCRACFTGVYPVPIGNKGSEMDW